MKIPWGFFVTRRLMLPSCPLHFEPLMKRFSRRKDERLLPPFSYSPLLLLLRSQLFPSLFSSKEGESSFFTTSLALGGDRSYNFPSMIAAFPPFPLFRSKSEFSLTILLPSPSPYGRVIEMDVTVVFLALFFPEFSPFLFDKEEDAGSPLLRKRGRRRAAVSPVFVPKIVLFLPRHFLASPDFS